MRTELKYIRKGKVFLQPGTGKVLEEFPSINAAKRESRLRQSMNGGLGGGLVIALPAPLKIHRKPKPKRKKKRVEVKKRKAICKS